MEIMNCPVQNQTSGDSTGCLLRGSSNGVVVAGSPSIDLRCFYVPLTGASSDDMVFLVDVARITVNSSMLAMMSVPCRGACVVASPCRMSIRNRPVPMSLSSQPSGLHCPGP